MRSFFYPLLNFKPITPPLKSDIVNPFFKTALPSTFSVHFKLNKCTDVWIIVLKAFRIRLLDIRHWEKKQEKPKHKCELYIECLSYGF